MARQYYCVICDELTAQHWREDKDLWSCGTCGGITQVGNTRLTGIDRRFQAACAAMQGDLAAQGEDNGVGLFLADNPQIVADCAKYWVCFADALLAALDAPPEAS